MNFCKMCGEPLRASPPLGGSAASPPAVAAHATPSKRSALPSALAAVVGGPPGGPAALKRSQPAMAARKPMVQGGSSPGPLPSSSSQGPPVVAAGNKPQRICTTCNGSTPVGFAFCQHCGTRLDISGPVPLAERDDLAALALSTTQSGSSLPNVTTVSDTAVADTLAGEADAVPLVRRRAATDAPGPGQAQAQAKWGSLVSVLRDGSDGAVHDLTDDAVDLGRSDGTLRFDDRFLAARHARIERRAGQTVVTPLETTNGVYYRLRAGENVVLVDGDLLLLGKEVLRFEILEPEERAPAAATQHGVRLFGSPVRSPWARLRQIAQSGMARDIYHLVAAEVTLGREEGDLRFSDDEFMSRRHARISNRDGRVEMVDLESSNGSFVRVRGERLLRRGDLIRLGDQLLRFEPL